MLSVCSHLVEKRLRGGWLQFRPGGDLRQHRRGHVQMCDARPCGGRRPSCLGGRLPCCAFLMVVSRCAVTPHGQIPWLRRWCMAWGEARGEAALMAPRRVPPVTLQLTLKSAGGQHRISFLAHS